MPTIAELRDRYDRGETFSRSDMKCALDHIARLEQGPGLDADPKHHARTSDPDTSKAAARKTTVTAQARRVLWSYADGSDLLDHEAYAKAGFDKAHHARQRCSDLRRAGYIERSGSKGRTPSNRVAYKCIITTAGRAFLAQEHPDDA